MWCPFAPACRRKGPFVSLGCPFPPQGEEKGILSQTGMLQSLLKALAFQARLHFHPACRGKGNSERQKQRSAIAFSVCLSRKRHFRSAGSFQEPAQRIKNPLPVDEKASPIGPERPREDQRGPKRSRWECSRLHFHPACRGKGDTEKQKRWSATGFLILRAVS